MTTQQQRGFRLAVNCLIESSRCLGVSQVAGDGDAMSHYNALIQDYKGQLQAAQQVQGDGEPVAFAFEDSLTGDLRDFSCTQHSKGMVPLYTHPQPAQPIPNNLRLIFELGAQMGGGAKLTQEQCKAMIDATDKPAQQVPNWTDIDTAKLVNRLTDIACSHKSHQQLRERIAKEIRPVGALLTTTEPFQHNPKKTEERNER